MNIQIYLLATCLAAFTAAAPQGIHTTYLQPEPSYEISSISNNKGGDKYLPPATTTAAPVVHKQFYSISAPTENEPKMKILQLGRPQINYRVIFVKAPLPENDNIKYAAQFAPQEEKTVIYVLSKKENDLNAEDIATPAPTAPSKPEVFFIKYKTNEEAEAAQKEIKDQFKDLGGTEDESTDNNAPVASVIGALDGGYEYSPIQGSESSSLADYVRLI